MFEMFWPCVQIQARSRFFQSPTRYQQCSAAVCSRLQSVANTGRSTRPIRQWPPSGLSMGIPHSRQRILHALMSIGQFIVHIRLKYIYLCSQDVFSGVKMDKNASAVALCPGPSCEAYSAVLDP